MGNGRESEDAHRPSSCYLLPLRHVYSRPRSPGLPFPFPAVPLPPARSVPPLRPLRSHAPTTPCTRQTRRPCSGQPLSHNSTPAGPRTEAQAFCHDRACHAPVTHLRSRAMYAPGVGAFKVAKP